MSSNRPDNHPLELWRELETIEHNVKTIREILESAEIDDWQARGHLSALAQNTVALAWRVADSRASNPK